MVLKAKDMQAGSLFKRVFAASICLILFVLLIVQHSYADLTNEFRIEELTRFADLIIRGTIIGRQEVAVQDVYKGVYSERVITVSGLEEYNNGSTQESRGSGEVKSANLANEEVLLLLRKDNDKWVLVGYPSYDRQGRLTGEHAPRCSVKIIRGDEVYGYVALESSCMGCFELWKDPWTPTFKQLIDAINAPAIVRGLQLFISTNSNTLVEGESFLLDFEVKYRKRKPLKARSFNQDSLTVRLRGGTSDSEASYQVLPDAFLSYTVPEKEMLTKQNEVYFEGTIDIMKCGFKPETGGQYFITLYMRSPFEDTGYKGVLESNTICACFDPESSPTDAAKEASASESAHIPAETTTVEEEPATEPKGTANIKDIPLQNSTWPWHFYLLAFVISVAVVCVALMLLREKKQRV